MHTNFFKYVTLVRYGKYSMLKFWTYHTAILGAYCLASEYTSTIYLSCLLWNHNLDSVLD